MQISQLKIMVQHSQPLSAWRILQSIDGSYSLEFSWLLEDNPLFTPVRTRRETIKNYKSIKAVFSDIEKVQQTSLIYYEATNIE